MKDEPAQTIAAAWLFDFDNTLVALEPEVDWAASRVELEAYLRREGVADRIFTEFPKGNLILYEALRGRLTQGGAAFDEVAAHGLARADPATLIRHASAIIESYELRGVARAVELPGATKLLRALADNRRPIAIVTSNSSRTVGVWLERERLTDWVRIVVGRDAMLPLKPAPDAVLQALERCGVATADAIFVGDSEADAHAARAAGVRLIGVTTDPARHRRLAINGALAMFDSPSSLARYLGFVIE